jgi:hypothetical protein
MVKRVEAFSETVLRKHIPRRPLKIKRLINIGKTFFIFGAKRLKEGL